MNHSPDDILKLLQRSEPLSSAEKKAIAKTVRGLEKELTAKDRELQIEASLECVRVVALAMKQPADMLEICKMISRQFESLRVKEIRNVQTAIFNQDKGTYFNYEYYTKHDTTVFTETDYKNHPVHLEFADRMLKGGGEVFIRTIAGNELPDWIQYQKTTNVFIDSFLESASSLTHYWYSLGPVALGMSTYEPLTKEEIELFKRFKNVFELSYRRYLDIAQAEAQARESQIQLALERVRARTMAMQKSDELSETVFILFQQFRELGENPDQATIGIMNEKEHVIEYWVTMYGSQTNQVFKFSIDEPHVTNKIYNAWKEGKKSFAIDLTGKDLLEFMTYRAGKGGAAINPGEKRRVINVAFFSKGLLNVQSNESRSEESIKLLERFAAVFEQTYTRFLDLQKAEGQAREARIEAALERVRSRTMGMQKSEELKEVIQIVYEQFVHLNVLVEHAGFIMDYKARDDMHIWLADMHAVPFEVTIPYFDCAHWNSFNEAKEKGIGFFVNHLTFEEKNKFYQDLFELIPGVPDETKEYYFSCPGLAISTVLLENIGLYIENFAGTPYTNEENTTLMRFGKVFQQTYTRFLDLQKAEMQSREAQIEASLERVRGRAMAMHSSSDLSAAAAMIFTELKKLGIKPIRSGVVLVSKESHQAQSYSAIPGADGEELALTGEFGLSGNPVLEQQYQYWLRKENYFTSLKGEDLKSYYKAISSGGMNIINRDNIAADQEEFGHWLMFSEGFLFAWSGKKYSGEEIKILDRFKNIVELTFRRFLDLQKAEAQTREAQIEAALERVRSKAMAMQKSEDLGNAIAIVFEELNKLSIGALRCGISIIDKEKHTTDIWSTAKADDRTIVQVSGDESMEIHPLLQGAYHAWLKLEDFSYVLEGDDLQRFYTALAATNFRLPESSGTETISGAHTQYLYVAHFPAGGLYAFRENAFNDEAKNVIKRFGDVFNLTYTRFLDLQKAEAQAKEAELERKRSESLLLNILPEEIANELKQFGKSYARKHEQVTILFADIKNFSSIAENLSAQELVTQLDECFRAFDHIVDKHGLEKIKTVGDAYVCACGLPKPVADHAVKAVRAALDMMSFIKGFAITKTIQDLPAFEFRVGINTGSVITGVVGLKKFTYDIWGDAVNMAARMEQHGEAGRINISDSTYQLIKDKFACTPRGKIEAKNKGEVEMYFVEGLI